MSELEMATLEDMVAELTRRTVDFAVVVSHGLAGSGAVGGDIEDGEEIYGSSFCQQHPANMAGFLLLGVQMALAKLRAMPASDEDEIERLARQVMEMADRLERIYERDGEAS